MQQHVPAETSRHPLRLLAGPLLLGIPAAFVFVCSACGWMGVYFLTPSKATPSTPTGNAIIDGLVWGTSVVAKVISLANHGAEYPWRLRKGDPRIRRSPALPTVSTMCVDSDGCTPVQSQTASTPAARNHDNLVTGRIYCFVARAYGSDTHPQRRKQTFVADRYAQTQNHRTHLP
jgi:hypothetical protein